MLVAKSRFCFIIKGFYVTKDKLGLLKERLLAPLPGRQAQELMLGRVRAMPVTVPPTAVLSAVLCLLFPIGNDLHILLMKRGEDRSAHSGQVSFPGGRYEDSDNSLTETALREANEEVGIVAFRTHALSSFSFSPFSQSVPAAFMRSNQIISRVFY